MFPHISAKVYCHGSFKRVEFVVNEAFDKKRNHDMRVIKETQKFKLGDAQGTPR